MQRITQHQNHTAPPATREPLVQLDCLQMSYEEAGRQHTILRDLSATFYTGETVVLMGKSGSGKSTLLNLMSAIDTPTGGDVWIGGPSLTQLSEQERTLFRRRNIGFIFHFFNLVSTLTVLENIVLPLELNGHSRHEGAQAAREMLARVGLEQRANSFPDRLSGGEQQRIAIARALIHNPLLILADEPTGNLDSDTSEHVLDLLDTLTRQAGKSLLMVTHSPDAARMADRVFQLREGRLHEEPSPSTGIAA
jgi:putative ABC transport system ATP-binding protein